MNNAIKGGTAWGEAAMVLQKMGVLTADARYPDGADEAIRSQRGRNLGGVCESVETFRRAMLRMAGSGLGLTSTIADTVNISGTTRLQALRGTEDGRLAQGRGRL